MQKILLKSDMISENIYVSIVFLVDQYYCKVDLFTMLIMRLGEINDLILSLADSIQLTSSFSCLLLVSVKHFQYNYLFAV